MPSPSVVVKYNDPATVLEGQVYTDFYYGRPTYGMSPDVDEIEHPIILALDQSISVAGAPQADEWNYDIPEPYVDRVQISTPHIEMLRQFKGHGVRLRGTLWHSHTGHHHTNVLMSVDEPPVIVDSRNAFPDGRLVSSGSGFLLGSGGFIGTAAHVLEDADQFSVTRGLYRQHASVVAVDQGLDLAILKIEPRGPLSDLLLKRELKVRPTRTWMAPRLGERVYAFGFPLGGTLPHSLNMTEGLISSEMGYEKHQFQISAAIQNGNSGGPVFDEFGNLVGVALSSIDSGQTLNFCVQGWQLSRFCHESGVDLNQNELGEIKIEPRTLAEAALHFCVEVEGWTKVVRD